MLNLRTACCPPKSRLIDAYISKELRRISILIADTYFVGFEVSRAANNDDVCIVAVGSETKNNDGPLEYLRRFPAPEEHEVMEIVYIALTSIERDFSSLNWEVLEFLKYELLCHILVFNGIQLEVMQIPDSFSIDILTPLSQMIS